MTAHPLSLLDDIERAHEERSRDLARILSAAAWTPKPVEPRRGAWARLLTWIGRRA